MTGNAHERGREKLRQVDGEGVIEGIAPDEGERTLESKEKGRSFMDTYTENKTDNRASVTVIGLGLMGSALAAAFLNGGYPTTVWNRSEDKADPLIHKGATRAATVADAVSASPLVVVCLTTYETVHEVLDLVGDALSGRVLVNLTNGTPDQARRTAAWAVERGADYLDGGIMAVSQMIAGPDAHLLYSGSPDGFEAHRRELESLGTSRYLGTDAGLASLYDLALLGGMYGMLAGFFHSVALVGTEKVAATEFTSLLVPWLNAMAGMLPGLAQEIDAGDYPTDVSGLDVNKDAVANILQASRDQGIGVDLLAPLQALIDQRVADGHGADSLSSLIEVIRKPAPAA